MYKTSKLIACMLVLLQLLGIFGLTASASQTQALALTAPTQPVTVGQDVWVSIDAELGDRISDGVVQVVYDAERLAYKNAEGGTSWSENADLSLRDNCKNGTVTLAFAAVDTAAKGEIIRLRFTALKAGSALVSINDEESYLTDLTDCDLRAELTLTLEEPAPVTVTFVDGYTETVIETQTVPYGQAATAPEAPEHGGYYFLGWDQDFSCVTADLTVTALYCTGEENCPGGHFTDVLFSAWYHEAIDYAVENGYFNGVSATEFAPDDFVTRGMLVTVLHRMTGLPEVEAQMPFTDVPEGVYYYDAVLWAYTEGIAKGTGAELFDPEASLTRQELVTFLYRYAAYLDYDVTASASLEGFMDGGKVAPWAEAAMQWAVAEGLITGISEAVLLPQGEATRAQIAALTMRLDRAYES